MNTLPSNPSTVSDTRQQANTWSAQTVSKKYAGRQRTAELIAEVNADLAELLAWDNYERQTSPMRESVKAQLRDLAGI